MSALFDMPKAPRVAPPPPPPKMEDPAVAERAERERRSIPGRASQFFSDPQANLVAGPSKRQYLGGV